MQTNKLTRIKEIKAQTKIPASTVYFHIREGLFPKPIKIGERMSAWLQSEVDAIMNARIAGKSEDEIKELVKQLEAQRTGVAA